jgi:ATP-dependent RNA helicase SUPV3L1/SUV3
LDGIALRPDRLERLAAAARRLARRGPFTPEPELAAIAGVEQSKLRGLVATLGYRAVICDGKETFVARSQRQRDAKRTGRRRGPVGDGHPFAKLRELKLA